MADEKKRNRRPEFKFDTLVQGLADKIIKPALPAALNRLEQKNRTLWMNGAWVYLKAPAEIREAFEGTLRLGVLGIEWFVDTLKLPHVINDALEFMAVRILSQLPDYYKQQENKEKFEATPDFQPLTLEQAKEVGKELARAIMEELRDPIKRLRVPFGTPVGKLGSPARFMQNLFQCFDDPMTGEEMQENFWIFTHDWLIRDDDAVNGPWYEQWKPLTAGEKEEWFKRLITYLDEQHEVRPFFSLELPEQVISFKIGIIMKKKEAWPAVVQYAKKNWPACEAWLTRNFKEVADALRGVRGRLVLHKEQRAREIDETRHSVESMTSHPWRKDEVPSDDYRRRLAETELAWRKFHLLKPRTWPISSFGRILFLVSLGGGAFAGGFTFITSRLDADPQVSITSPNAGVRLTTPSVTVRGTATDDHEVAAVDVSLNGQPYERLYVLPKRRVSWMYQVTELKPGRNVLGVQVSDDRRQLQTVEHIFYFQPAAPDTTRAPELVVE